MEKQVPVYSHSMVQMLSIECRILLVLKKWIENAFNDFLDDKKLMGQLVAFIGKTLPATGNLDAAKSLQKDITNVTMVIIAQCESIYFVLIHL